MSQSNNELQQRIQDMLKLAKEGTLQDYIGERETETKHKKRIPKLKTDLKMREKQIADFKKFSASLKMPTLSE